MKMFCCMQRQDSSDVRTRYCPRRKLVVVGDGECGKTCLLHRYTKDEYDDTEYRATVFEMAATRIEHQSTEVELSLFDTAGQEGYDRLRPLSYPDSDVVLICFSVANPDSLENVSYCWAPEVRHFCGNVPVLLVGLKADLRDTECEMDSSKRKAQLTTVRQGEDMAYRVGAVAYMECSAKLDIGVVDVFRKAAEEALKKRTKGKKKKTHRR